MFLYRMPIPRKGSESNVLSLEENFSFCLAAYRLGMTKQTKAIPLQK
jgi:hypothetical protein